MPVFRVEKNRNYTVMSNIHLKDKSLTLKSKGLLSLILSLPEEWNFTARGLAAISKDGVDSIGTALKELESVGYLVRNRLRDEFGRISDIEYVIYEFPQKTPNAPPPDLPSPNTVSPHTENPYMDNPVADKPNMVFPDTESPCMDKPDVEKPNTVLPYTENPYMDKPDVDKPDTVLPYTENPYMDNPDVDKPDMVFPDTEKPAQLITNKLIITKISSMKKTNHARADCGSAGQLSLNDVTQQVECLTVKTARGTGKPVNHTMTLVEQQFESFWELYPRKAGKKTAKRAWENIKPDDVLFATIMSGLKTAVQYWHFQNISEKHIPHPSTWLNEERWQDEFSTENFSRSKGLTLETKGGEQIVTIGANYTIGGENDPYRELMAE